MIKMLMVDDIQPNWETIKYAVQMAHSERSESQKSVFCRDLLTGLYKGDSQCWFMLDENRVVKLVLLTNVVRELIDYQPCLVVSIAYGYEPSTKEDKADLKRALNSFASSRGCNKVHVITSSKIAANAAETMGMKLTSWILTMEVKNE